MKNLKQKIKEELPSRFLEKTRLGNSPDKKTNEIDIAKGFFNRLGPDIKSVITPSESPDFFVEIDNYKIGLEVTSFFLDQASKGSKGNELFERWRKLAEQLSTMLSQKGIKSWFGAIHFHSPFDKSLNGLDEKQFFIDIVSLAESRLSRFNGKNLSLYPDSSSYLGKVVHHISCFNAEPLERSLWWHSSLQSGLINNLNENIVRICHKKDKLTYNKVEKADELWLLIFARGAHLWEQALITWPYLHRHEQDKQLQGIEVLTNLKMKVFDRIFLWNYRTESIWEIHPTTQILFHHDKTEFVLRINKIPQILRPKN